MPGQEQLNDLKTQFGHIFDVEESGNLILKDHFGIPPFKLIYVEGDQFTMGGGDEAHPVKLSSFYMAEYPVTQELYKSVIGKNPSRFEGINHPVEQVSWYNAVEFCESLNKKLGILPGYYRINKEDKDENNQSDSDKQKWIVHFNRQGNGFRLPTEAEWEFAAGGGKSPLKRNIGGYAGSDHLDDVGWYRENNNYETKPVGLKFPNQLGIYDLSGNVWEWCWDWNHVYFKNQVNKRNKRSMRGGAWRNSDDDSRISVQYDRTPEGLWRDCGFRLIFAF